MKITELRIGNWVRIHTQEYQMTIEDFNFKEDFIKPIPLTEEWLLKFGFEKTRWGMRRYPLEIRGSVVMFGHQSAQRHLNIRCEYIHQLQNLYFSLTNQELTIEL